MRDKVRVVLVDDNDDLRLLVRVGLEADGRFEIVGEAADGSEAIEVCEQLRPDAVVLDLLMPVMTGDQALPILQASCPETAVVVFTAHAESGRIHALIAEGAAAVLSKTSPPAAVAHALMNAIARRSVD